jgi:dTDP-4-dehydrorhamnose reductase
MTDASTARVLLTGGQGQLGVECRLAVPADVELWATDKDELDLSDSAALREAVRRFQPHWILHAGAWTAVDAAEEHEAAAHAINAEGTRALAEAAAEVEARMAYVSTDYVFSGQGSRPWQPEDPVDPINAYGRTKLAGEQALHAALGERGHVVRTSWVYGRRGANFVRTMLRLMGEGRDLTVVGDQFGAPTWAGGLARALWALTAQPTAPAILHYSDQGITTWCEFAQAIREEGLGCGLDLADSSVSPCSTEDYPTPATRPAWSPLELSAAWAAWGVAPQGWRETLHEALPVLLAETQLAG